MRQREDVNHSINVVYVLICFIFVFCSRREKMSPKLGIDFGTSNFYGVQEFLFIQNFFIQKCHKPASALIVVKSLEINHAEAKLLPMKE